MYPADFGAEGFIINDCSALLHHHVFTDLTLQILRLLLRTGVNAVENGVAKRIAVFIHRGDSGHDRADANTGDFLSLYA